MPLALFMFSEKRATEYSVSACAPDRGFGLDALTQVSLASFFGTGSPMLPDRQSRRLRRIRPGGPSGRANSRFTGAGHLPSCDGSLLVRHPQPFALIVQIRGGAQRLIDRNVSLFSRDMIREQDNLAVTRRAAIRHLD